jgi:ribosomal-protein-alanine N-acetyltransferase
MKISTISTNNFYSQALPIVGEASIRQKIKRVFTATFLGGGIGLGLGLAAGGHWTFIILLAGAAVGLVAGFCWHRFKNKSLSAEPLKILDTVRNSINSIKLQKSIDSVKQVLSQKPIHFKQTFDHHALHQDITDLTDEIKTRPDLVGIWEIFLKKIQGVSVNYPDGTQFSLDVSFEQRRLGRGFSVVTTEMLNPRGKNFNQEIDQLYVLQQECFGKKPLFSKTNFKNMMASPQNGAVIARDQHTQQIIGFLWYRAEGNVRAPNMHICGVGRKAGAAKLKIGDKLFEHLLRQDLSQYQQIFLEVRKSNKPAISLYKKYGFNTTQDKNSYYTYPNEGAHIMAYQHAQQKNQVA